MTGALWKVRWYFVFFFSHGKKSGVGHPPIGAWVKRLSVEVGFQIFLSSNSATFWLWLPIHNSATKTVVRTLRSCGHQLRGAHLCHHNSDKFSTSAKINHIRTSCSCYFIETLWHHTVHFAVNCELFRVLKPRVLILVKPCQWSAWMKKFGHGKYVTNQLWTESRSEELNSAPCLHKSLRSFTEFSEFPVSSESILPIFSLHSYSSAGVPSAAWVWSLLYHNSASVTPIRP